MTTVEAVRPEILDASDEQIDEAVAYADPMVMRGLLYQLTGHQELAETQLACLENAACPAAIPVPESLLDEPALD